MNESVAMAASKSVTADMESGRIEGWEAMRTRWRRHETELRAPGDLVDKAFAEFESERRAARKRSALLGLSVAASILVLVGAWSVLPGNREAVQGEPASLPVASATLPAGVESGACAEPGSCIDLAQALASIDLEVLMRREMPGGADGSQATAMWELD